MIFSSIMTTAYAKLILTGGDDVHTIESPSSNLNVDRALITAEGAGIRFWVDGSTPTAAEGHLMENLKRFVFYGARTIENVKIYIPTGQKVMVTFFA